MNYIKSTYSLIYIVLLAFFISSYSSANVPQDDGERRRKIAEQLKIASETLRTDIQKSWSAAQEAKRLSANFDLDRLLQANIYIANVYQQKGKIDSAQYLLDQAVREAKVLKNDTLLALTYHSIGLNYHFNGSVDLAIDNYHKALQINESINNHFEATRQLNNIGLLYRDEEQFDLSLDYLQQSIDLSRKNGFKRYEYFGVSNIGYVYLTQGKYKEAEEGFQKALDMSGQFNDANSLCTANYLMADVKLKRNDYTAAKSFANIALEIADKIDYNVGKVYGQRVLAEAFLMEKDYVQARKIIDDCIDYIKTNSTYIYYQDVQDVNLRIEEETGNYSKALLIQKDISARKDSLSEIKAKEKIANSEYRYQLLKNEQENQLLTIKNTSNKRISYLATAIAVLLLLLGLFALYGYLNSKNYNATLEEAINERTKELQESNSELERFTFITAHDLKEPSRNLISYSTLINRSIEKNDTSNINSYAAIISKNATQLYNLIDGIMKFSSIKQLDADKVEHIDLTKLIHEIKSLLADTIEKSNVTLEVKELPNVKGEKPLMLILFKNLIENAIKFNDKDEKYIEIGTKESPNGQKIYVKDNGIGIESNYADQVFEMFKKLHPKHEYDGSGLGLSICKRIAQLHHYNMGIEENELGGATIFIEPQDSSIS